MTLCGNPLLRLLLGVKRTSLFSAQMSAFDPKRTWRGHWNLRKIEHRREPPGGDMQRRGESGQLIKGQRTTGPKARKAPAAHASANQSAEQCDRLKHERDEALEQLAATSGSCGSSVARRLIYRPCSTRWSSRRCDSAVPIERQSDSAGMVFSTTSQTTAIRQNNTNT